MAKKKDLIWLGKGCFNFDGKDYFNGDILPCSEITEATLKRLLKLKKAGNPTKATSLSDSVELIKAQSLANSRLKEEISGRDEQIKELHAEISEKDELISNLQKDQTSKGKKPSDS